MAYYKNNRQNNSVVPRLKPLPFDYCEGYGCFFRKAKENEKTGEVVFLDLETTGLNISKDEVIEVGMVRATYSKATFEILEISKAYDGFREPSAPLSETIVNLTGLTDEKLHGCTLDFKKIFEILKDCSLIISHNAAFDRPFFEKLMEGHIDSKFYWGCSMEGVSWRVGHKKESCSLPKLVRSVGYEYEAHRAINDVFALLTLLIKENALKELLINTSKGYEIIRIKNADNLPYDELRKLRFMYKSEQNSYYKTIHGSQLNYYLTGLNKLGIANEDLEVKQVSGLNAFRLM